MTAMPNRLHAGECAAPAAARSRRDFGIFSGTMARRSNCCPMRISTPQRKSPGLSARFGVNVQLKLEMLQHSGSFKTRGAFHQMLTLGNAALSRGVVAVSGGNFARAVGYCSGVLGVDAIVCMPENAPQSSIDATRDYGATVELLPDAVAAFARADEWVSQGCTALHPFDNPAQIAGNAIVALEIMEDCPQMTDIVVSIGGGGLIAGIIAAVKAMKPEVRVWGVEPDTAPTMRRSLDAGEIVNIKPASLSKTLGAPFVGRTALELCREHLEDLISGERPGYDPRPAALYSRRGLAPGISRSQYARRCRSDQAAPEARKPARASDLRL